MPRTDPVPARLRRLIAAAHPDPGLLTDHEVVLRPAGGRNAAVIVEVDGEPRWVAKPAHHDEPSREAAMLRGLAGGPLARAVPRVHADGADGLVTIHVAGVRADAVPATAPGHLAAIGRFMRTLHGLPAPAEGSRAPWITRIHRPTPRRLAWSSAAMVGLIRDIQAHDGMCAALDGLAAAWRPESLTHGDLRLANVLVDGADRITVVDWEAAGAGPAALDLGWVAGDLLLRWAMALDPGTPSEALALRAGGPALAQACGAVDRLLAAYGAGADRADALRWAGARLLQAAAESCQAELFVPAGTRTVALAARLVLTRTEAFAERIAGAA